MLSIAKNAIIRKNLLNDNEKGRSISIKHTYYISNVILDVLTGRKELIRIKLTAGYAGDDNNNSKTEIRADLVAMTKRSLRVLCACSRLCTNPSDTQARVPLRKSQRITNHILANCQKVASESFLSEL